ncbi:hypothetical protein [Pseudoxanthomonas spadix]|uniref:hypothetical protein n=1 Tax=Pseudoxanthomonas spadix TaxID=415229 RepID=UPI0011D2A779|nr:hypothetical protein [Pseudoxanthomonas spadix]
MRYSREFLTPDVRGIIDRGLSTPASKAMIDAVFGDMPRESALLNNARTALEARFAAGYIIWRSGELTTTARDFSSTESIKLGPKTRSAMLTVKDDLAKILGLAGKGDVAERIFQDIAVRRVERIKNLKSAHATMDNDALQDPDVRRAYRLRSRNGVNDDLVPRYDPMAREARERGTKQKLFNQAAEIIGVVGEALSRAVDGKWARLSGHNVPALRQIGVLLQKPHGSAGEDRGYIPAARDALARRSNYLRRAVAGMKRGEMARAMTLLQSGATDLSAERPVVQEAVAKIRAFNVEMMGYMREAGMNVGNRGANYFPVMLNVVTDAQKNTLRTPATLAKQAKPHSAASDCRIVFTGRR